MNEFAPGWHTSFGDYDVTELGFGETVRVTAGCFGQAAACACAETDWFKRVDAEKLKLRVTCPDTGMSKLYGFRLEPMLVALD